MAGLVAIAAACGVYLLYTAFMPGVRTNQRMLPRTRHRKRLQDWLTQAGLSNVPVSEFAGVVIAVTAGGALVGYLLFGGALAAAAVGALAGAAPVGAYRQRRIMRQAAAQDAWPHIIEEIRLLTGSAGRSIPQALLEAGESGPEELCAAFAAARREWMISTDFNRTLEVLKRHLADPTADAACETLLVAHEVGGTDLDRRLEALAEDRRRDVQDRKDARAKQAGVRFARRFTLIVPIGMALAGLSVGTGRAAYETPHGQVLVLVAIALMVACWLWAGRLMRLPESERVFGR
ncbi:MAG: type II secretion system F family protein [Acidimicrobiales bacterium]|nr:type II secretion system F family protein [Acidimicrobiales bacterium]